MDPRFGLAIMAAGLLLGALFSVLCTCLEEMSRSEFDDLAGPPGSGGVRGRADRILRDVEGHARAVALARILCNLTSVVATVGIVAAFRGSGSPGVVDALLGVLIGTPVVWLGTVTIADSVAQHAAARAALKGSRLIRALWLLQKPLAPVAIIIDGTVRRLAGAGKVSKQEEAAEEVLEAIEEGQREGALDEREGRMIEAVVDFKRRTVEQIMTPRTEIEALEMTSNLGQIAAFVRKARHSRIPVYKAGGTLDDVVGFFYVKDLLRWLAGDAPGGKVQAFDLKQIIRPATFVPESKTVRDVLEELLAKKVHAAMVADEYGGVAGIVSLEDIIEEVFGEIQDEYEKAEDEPPKIDVKPDPDGGGQAEIDARAYVGDVNSAIEPLGVAIPEDDEYDTLGGFVLTHLGRIPEVNESFSHGRAVVTVLEATPTRVVKVRVQVRSDEMDPAGSRQELVGGK
jgi:putative hemolysin